MEHLGAPDAPMASARYVPEARTLARGWPEQ